MDAYECMEQSCKTQRNFALSNEESQQKVSLGR